MPSSAVITVETTVSMPQSVFASSVPGSGPRRKRFIESLIFLIADHVLGFVNKFGSAKLGPVRNSAIAFSTESSADSPVAVSVEASWSGMPLALSTVTDAQSLQADISGVDIDGLPETRRLVLVRHPRNIGDIVDDSARGPRDSTHNGQVYQGTYDAFEQQVTVAEQLAWVHTFSDGITRDSGDVLNELMEFAIQWRNATGLPTMAK